MNTGRAVIMRADMRAPFVFVGPWYFVTIAALIVYFPLVDYDVQVRVRRRPREQAPPARY